MSPFLPSFPEPWNSIADLRDIARSRIPRALFDYIDRGSYDELTWNRNRDDLRALQLRQRVMVDVSRISLGTTVLGEHWNLPVGLAPTGLTGLFHRDGEIEAARAAQRAGVPFTLSTMSICSLEDVRAAVEGNFWFQLYLMRDRGFNEALIARAREARCSALMVTLDLPLQGLRRRDPKNGLSVPLRLTAANAWEIFCRPRWLSGVMLGRRRTLGNLAAFFPKSGIGELSQWVGGQFDPVDHLARHRLGARALAGQTTGEGHPRRGGRAPGVRTWHRRRCRLESRWHVSWMAPPRPLPPYPP